MSLYGSKFENLGKTDFLQNETYQNEHRQSGKFKEINYYRRDYMGN